MTISYLDNTQVTTTTTGTGTLTQGSAVTGFRAPAAGDDGKTYTVMVKGVDGSGVPTGEFELCESVYTHSGTTWSRGTLLDSSTGSRISFAAGTKRISVVIEVSKFIDARIRQPEVAITTTATATIGRYHVCTGTTSDYTVTLPTAVGNTGRELHFRMSTALTKLVTLDGNGTETINGTLTRIMHDGESATLISDGANWFKVGGKSTPFAAKIGVVKDPGNSGQLIATTTVTKVTLGTLGYGTSYSYDLATSSLIAPRTGNYIVLGILTYNSLALSTNTISRVHVNGTYKFHAAFGTNASTYPALAAFSPGLPLIAGDLVTLHAYQATGSNANLYVEPAIAPVFLEMVEVIQW